MAPKPTSCVACGASFPANLQLATIPDANRIAFDPSLDRVWRICSSCGEWNLLGVEASAAALPELESRFVASPKRSSGAGFALAQVGTALDLLRIGATNSSGRNEIAILARRHRIQLIKRVRIPALCATALIVGWEFVAAYQNTNSVLGVAELVGSMGLVCLAYFGSRLRHHLGANMRAMVLAAAVGVIGEGLWFVNQRHWLAPVARAISLIVMNGIIVWLPPFAYLKIPLSGGKLVRVHLGDDVKQVAIWWNSDGELFVGGLPGTGDFGGVDARLALRALVMLKNRTTFVGRATSDAAYDLVRTAGGLRGLFHALEGFRADNTGRVLLADLPKVYLVALDLALTESANPRDVFAGFQRQALDANAIAREAEALDGD